MQKRFREELGLIIDKPRQVSGNTNDGNTARRFFYNASCSAEITGVDENLIKRFYIILQALSSDVMINAESFGSYAVETARIYVTNYGWYYMPSSVHKILLLNHVLDQIQRRMYFILFCTLPIRTSPALENRITKMCKNLMEILCSF